MQPDNQPAVDACTNYAADRDGERHTNGEVGETDDAKESAGEAEDLAQGTYRDF